MTEAEWLASDQIHHMVRFLCNQPGVRKNQPWRRKMRLWGCACCRLQWDRLTDERSRKAVEMAERLADGQATRAEADEAERQAMAALQTVLEHSGGIVPIYANPAHGAVLVLERRWNFYASAGTTAYRGSYVGPAEPPYPDLLRDIFGNPFRSVNFHAAWRTAAVVALAQTIYDERDFLGMPILGDALEEAGCEDTRILGHCRIPGPHALGCWVVDLILGRA
jgi:hypothetical protein